MRRRFLSVAQRVGVGESYNSNRKSLSLAPYNGHRRLLVANLARLAMRSLRKRGAKLKQTSPIERGLPMSW